MKAILDENNVIGNYAIVGDIEDSIEIKCKIPNDFDESVYKYENKKLIKDEKRTKEQKEKQIQKQNDYDLLQQFKKEKEQKEFAKWKENQIIK